MVTGSITIVGPTGANGLTLAGTGKSGDLRLFEVMDGGELTLENLTLTKWASDNSGGAIYVERGGTATLTRCTIANSFAAADGGAIFNNGTLNLMDSTLIGNEATNGGGFMNYGAATLNGSTLTNNRASVDGGGFNSGKETYGGPVTLTDCRVSGNKAGDRGGGFILFRSSAVLTNCTLSGNSAHEGGGLANFGDIVLNGTTIQGNSAADGGGLFNAPHNVPEQVGGGDGDSSVTANHCNFTGNSAKRGGGLFNASTATLTDCVLTDNRADLGGGILNEARNPTLNNGHGSLAISGTLLSKNRAVFAGGGLFINGNALIETTAFTQNRASRGGAVFNDLGSTELVGGAVTKNVSSSGAALFNHLGVLSFNGASVKSSPGPVPLGTAAPQGVRIVKGPDGIRYALLRNHNLLRQLPGCSWTVLDDAVLEYKIAPNGDIYWLNDRRELYRAQAGYAGNILGAGAQLAMDENGTVYELSSLIAPGNFARFRSLTAPLLDPLEEAIDPGVPSFCLEYPTGEEILSAARLGEIQNLRYVIEPIADSFDAPRYFPKVGLAQMHVCQYKITMYFDAILDDRNADETSSIIYIDKNHLHRFVAGQHSQGNISRLAADHAAGGALVSGPALSGNTTAPSLASAVPYDPSNDYWVSERYTGNNGRSLVTAPDGTIYFWGSDQDGHHTLGSYWVPLVLNRLSPGKNWEVLFPVFQFAVDSKSTLYTLNGGHELQSLRSRSTRWTTLDTDVQSFSLASDGTLYALNANHELRSLRSGATHWKTVATGVQSFSMAPDGTIYTLNNLQQLQRLKNRTQWSVLDRGVQSFSMADDGTLYELNDRHQLKKLTGGSRWTVLDAGVQSFTRELDGSVYVLDDHHQLKRLTARDHWILIDAGVESFVVAPNFFQNLYVLNDNHELKYLETGYTPVIVQRDVVSLTIDRDRPFAVHARDSVGRDWMYSYGSGAAPVLDPVEGEHELLLCLDPPSPDEVVRFSHLATSDIQYFPTSPEFAAGSIRLDSNAGISAGLTSRFTYDPTSPFSNFRIAVEPLVDNAETIGVFPFVGPARLHHCHYKATIYFDSPDGPQQQVLFLDHDHLIRAPFSG